MALTRYIRKMDWFHDISLLLTPVLYCSFLLYFNPCWI